MTLAFVLALQLFTSSFSFANVLPDSSCLRVANIDVTNDVLVSRNHELARGGVPFPFNFHITNTTNLIVVRDGVQSTCPNTTTSILQVIPAQYRPLSRWNAGPQDENAPIQWLEVSMLVADMEGNTTQQYILYNCPTLPDVFHITNEETVSNHVWNSLASETLTTIDIRTGLLHIHFNKTSPHLITSIYMKSNAHSDTYGTPVFNESDTYNIARSGVQLNGLSAENVACRILENGHVKAVVLCEGDFNASPCPTQGHRPSFSLIWTFLAGSGDLIYELNVYNECGDVQPRYGQQSTLDYRLVVSSLLISLPTRDVVVVEATANNTTHTTDLNMGSIAVKQHAGRNQGSGWRRKYSIQQGDILLEQGEYLLKPQVSVTLDSNVTISTGLANMRYREPQALLYNNNIIGAEVLFSDNNNNDIRRIGVGQGVVNFGSFTISSRSVSQNRERTIQNVMKIERGLLIHTNVEDVNNAKVFPLLPTNIDMMNTSAGRTFSTMLQNLHAWTIAESDGQWARQRNYGALQWPDYQFDQWQYSPSPDDTPDGYEGKSNYWSATSSVLLMFIVDGRPHWVWDYALWLEHVLWKTIAFNPGRRCGQEGAMYHGLGVGVDYFPYTDGARYRQSGGSDDYFYNMGSDELYVIRPSYSLEQAFRCAGDSVVARYNNVNVSEELQTNRQRYVNQLVISRQVSQHMNALRYAAQFSHGNNNKYRNHLHSIMEEYANDNLFGGVLCVEDTGNHDGCYADQPFMNSAINFDVFRAYVLLYGNSSSATVIRNALVNHAQLFVRHNMFAGVSEMPITWPTGGVNGWRKELECDFNSTMATCNAYNIAGLEPIYGQEQSMHVAAVFIAHALDTDGMHGLCPNNAREVMGNALQILSTDSYYTAGAGWWKGISQALRDVLHGIAVASRDCDVGNINNNTDVNSSHSNTTTILYTSLTDNNNNNDMCLLLNSQPGSCSCWKRGARYL
eukprot:m.9916 g.9916  ORF g.9916 m.9916 type:complete len:964 (-) comp4165_c0_seq2:19-2910(-)